MRGVFILVLVLFSLPASAGDLSALLSSKLSIIVESARDYEANCPCPYSINDDDEQCQGNSAWCRPDGSAGKKPLCYAEEISNTDARNFSPREGKLPPERQRELGDIGLALLKPYSCPQQASAALVSN
jgi:hypothetical protein